MRWHKVYNTLQTVIFSTLYNFKVFWRIVQKITSFWSVSSRTLYWKVCRRERVYDYFIYSLDTRTFVGMQLWCAKGRSVCMIVYVCMLGCVGFIRSLKAFATWKYYIVILLRVCMDILYKDGSSFYMFNGQNGGEYWQVSHTQEEENKMSLFHSTSCYVLSIVIKHLHLHIYNWI